MLIEHGQFDLMERYRMATVWLSNLVQSLRIYRELRLPFLLGNPAEVEGTTGAITVDADNSRRVMPQIALLRSLSESLEKVVLAQQPDARVLLEDYAKAMKLMIGVSPNLEFVQDVGATPAARA